MVSCHISAGIFRIFFFSLIHQGKVFKNVLSYFCQLNLVSLYHQPIKFGFFLELFYFYLTLFIFFVLFFKRNRIKQFCSNSPNSVSFHTGELNLHFFCELRKLSDDKAKSN